MEVSLTHSGVLGTLGVTLKVSSLFVLILLVAQMYFESDSSSVLRWIDETVRVFVTLVPRGLPMPSGFWWR